MNESDARADHSFKWLGGQVPHERGYPREPPNGMSGIGGPREALASQPRTWMDSQRGVVTKILSKQAVLVLDFEQTFEGCADPVAIGVGYDGAIYAAGRCTPEDVYESRVGSAGFPKSQLHAPTTYRLVRHHPSAEASTLLWQHESLIASFIQPYPGGLLLAGARCRWRPEGPELHAVAIDWSGKELRRFTLGDGIQDLRTTRAGNIWVSYFDEGIFGNFGWSSPGPSPIGAPGLVSFAANGDLTFAYDAEAAGTDGVCDAYATNVIDDSEVWLYFYTEFPIVRVRGGSYRVWNFGRGGAQALAVRDERVLVFGDYQQRNLARVLELGRDSTTRLVEQFLVEDETGKPLDRATAWGVGRDLYLAQDRQVWKLDAW